ncbi:Uncharacterized protein FWK35_00004714, partial [Aphis craccivora]
YNTQFHSSHPFYLFGDISTEGNTKRNRLKIRSASKRRLNQMTLADKQHLDHTIKDYNKYLIYQNIIKYLPNIFIKYQRIKL